METLLIETPILPGKYEAFKRGHADFSGPRWPEFKAYLQRMGLTRQVEWLRRTPEGDSLIVLLEGDDPAQTSKRLAASDHPFDVEFAGIMHDIHGFDPASPAPDAALQLVFEYSAERMVAFEPNT